MSSVHCLRSECKLFFRRIFFFFSVEDCSYFFCQLKAPSHPHAVNALPHPSKPVHPQMHGSPYTSLQEYNARPGEMSREREEKQGNQFYVKMHKK